MSRKPTDEEAVAIIEASELLAEKLKFLLSPEDQEEFDCLTRMMNRASRPKLVDSPP